MTNTEQTVINLEEKPLLGYPVILDDPVNPKLPSNDTIPINDQTNSESKAVPEVILGASSNPEPAPVDNVIVDDPINLKPTITTELPLAGLETRAAIASGVCSATVPLIFLGITTIIPILQLIIGWRYSDECPINWHIPHYLVVAGTIGIIMSVLGIVQSLLVLLAKSKASDSATENTNLAACCCLCSILIVYFFLGIFLLGWFVVGCIWVFSAWNEVQYTQKDSSDYCHPTLYRFAFWLIIISILYHIYSFYHAFSQTRKQVIDQKKGPATLVSKNEV